MIGLCPNEPTINWKYESEMYLMGRVVGLVAKSLVSNIGVPEFEI